MKIKFQKGMALITVLLLTVLMVMFTVSMVFISSNHMNMMGNVEHKLRALKAAEAAAEYALTKLNNDPVWGYDSNTPDVLLDLDGEKAEIKFNGNEYLSYNNLRGKDSVLRSTIGDTKLSGSIGAYTAEIICKGISGDGKAVKYLKVVFVRNDVFPYPINSEGKILFNAGDVNIFGLSYAPDDPNFPHPPGNIHSNWDGSGYPDTDNLCDYWSISNADPNASTIYAHGGMASAVGDINLPDDPDKMTENPNLGAEGKLDFENIDPDAIIKDKGPSCGKKTEPATYACTSFYYIPDDPETMGKILGDTLSETEKETIATAYSIPMTPEEAAIRYGVDISIWDHPVLDLDYEVSYTDVSGIEEDVRKDWPSPPDNLGWDKIGGSSGEISVTWMITGVVPLYEDPLDPTRITGYDPVYQEGTENIPGVSLGYRTFEISPYNWPGALGWDPDNPPPADVQEEIKKRTDVCEYFENTEPGLGKIDPSGELVKFIPPGSTEEEVGMKLEATGESVNTAAKITLTDDIYVQGAVADVDDYKKDMGSLGVHSMPPPGNVFQLIPAQDSMEVLNADGSITTKYFPVSVELDLNGHNIYSEAHLNMDAVVTGEGCMVSNGKLSYLQGIYSENIVAISEDDININLKPGCPQYQIDNAYIYSKDDTIIQPLQKDSNWNWWYSETSSYSVKKDFTSGGNTISFESFNPPPFMDDTHVQVNRRREKRDPDGKGPEPAYTYYSCSIPGGTEIKYNGTVYDFTSYAIEISDEDGDGVYTTTVYQAGHAVIPPPFDQTMLDGIGSVITGTFDMVSEKPDVTVSGTVIGMNENLAEDGDFNGNNSIFIKGTKESTVTFNHSVDGLGRVTELRGEDFNVRIASWYELN